MDFLKNHLSLIFLAMYLGAQETLKERFIVIGIFMNLYFKVKKGGNLHLVSTSFPVICVSAHLA